MIKEIFMISVICVMFYETGQTGEIFNWYQRLIGGLPEWLRKPLGGCVRCFTGQSLFWYYLIIHFKDYNIINHLFYPSLGILLATILNYFYEKTSSY